MEGFGQKGGRKCSTLSCHERPSHLGLFFMTPEIGLGSPKGYKNGEKSTLNDGCMRKDC